ncbi:MAG: ATP-dependent helicase [Candidatus Limnocylindrales bacterium]
MIDPRPTSTPAPGPRARSPQPPVSRSQVAGLLRGLDRAQRRAVTHGEGPLLVVAGPGTGKTRVVARRIAWLIATRRARPDEILALTFTDKAADELQARVDELVPYGYADTAIHTFHAFGDRLVRDHAFELGLPGEPRVLSRAQAIVFVREHLFELGLERYRPLGDPGRFVAALVTLFGRAKDEGVTPERYAAYADGLARAAQGEARRDGADPAEAAEATAAALDDAARHGELARAFGRYEALLGASGLVDFGGQVALAERLLRERPDVRREVRARYRHVLVDEFQDTNPAQLALLSQVVGPGHQVSAVGDDDQSIYTFRGAALGSMLGFEGRFPGTRTIILHRNYRSRAPILAAAARLIRHNEPGRLAARSGLDTSLVTARRARPRPVRALGFATLDAEADWVGQEIAARLRRGTRAADIAVLVRTNRDAGPFLRTFDALGIPWRFSGASGLYAQPEVRELLAFLRTVADPDATLDLYALATSEPYRLGGLELTAVLEAARRRHRSLWQLLVELEDQPGVLRLSVATRRTLARLVRDVRDSVELAHRRPAGEVLYDHLRRSGRLARLVAAGPASEGSLQAVARFFAIVREQAALLLEDRVAALVPHLAALVAAGDDPAADEEALAERDAVAVLTVHKAKGLEFPFVFVVGLAEGRFPGRGRREALALPDELCTSLADVAEIDVAAHAEERRLAYVAMTRARDELTLTWSVRGEGRRLRRASPFVAEALDRPESVHLDEPGIAASGGGDVAASLERLGASSPGVPGGGPGGASEGAASGPLQLSFSQLESYLTCPQQYRLRYVVGLPTPAHHALVYGSALHAAVAAFHTSERRGRPLDERALLDVFEAHWQSEGFLSGDHELARHAAGLATLRRFRATRLDSGEPPPAAIEASFSVTFGGDRLRGRYDRVDETPQGVVITDYKSSDVRSPARARERARQSLQLGVYALAHEAQTGRLPAAVQLHFLESGLVGRAVPDTRLLERTRGKVARAAAGIRAAAFEADPDVVACGMCPYREICPANIA